MTANGVHKAGDGMDADMIAPCGMNCRLCYAYIRPRDRCTGCRAQNGNKPRSCLNCKIVMCEKRARNGWVNCASCDAPCRRLKDLDKRYKEKYHMSMIENLDVIRESGMEPFLRRQEERFRCPVCGGIVCVHRDECPSCKAPVWQPVTRQRHTNP